MTSKLGVYWSVMHRRAQDYEFFKRWQPSVFKIMDGGPPDYQFARDNLPNSLVIARDWALSEQHSDMLKDPVGTGKRHAQEWNQHQTRLGFDRAKTLVLGINEPRIWEPGVPEALRQYTIALCEEATKLGLRVGAMQLSVGWPNNDGPDTPPNWSMWHGVDNAIRHNNGALITHEYWADNGPSENWGWWAGRVLKCPWQVPIVIGECGIDIYVKDGSVNHAQRGWLGRVEPEHYARELAEYVGRMSGDSRYVGCAVFAADFASHEWYSFDIEPAYKAILVVPIASYPPSTGPQPVPPPPPPVQPLTGEVVTRKPSNIRNAPNFESDILEVAPIGTRFTLTGDAGEFYQVEHNSGPGGHPAYVHESVVSRIEDEPPVQPPPQGDTWTRSLAFILQQEGGWADDPNDSGGATMKGITIGTFKAWRAAHGQQTPTKDDLRNISDAEVEQIYREWYWLASGSDKLSWPLCLANMDTAVNAGVGRADEMLRRSNGNFLAYMGHLIDWYTRIENFEHFGRGWIRRRAAILLEASKP